MVSTAYVMDIFIDKEFCLADAMPIAKDIAGTCNSLIMTSPELTSLEGVNMRLEVGAVREMHWHLSAEWAYVLKGDLRISTVTADGDVWLDDVVRPLACFPYRFL